MSHTTSIKSVPIKSVSALRRAVNALREQGINISLEQNAVPRMYYQGQMAKHVKSKQDIAQLEGKPHSGLRFHENPDECDYVVRCHDAYYDIGLIYNRDGELESFFDDYDNPSFNVPETKTGTGPIRKFLGAAFAGAVQHWSGQREAGEQQLHSVGKFLQQYTLAATIEAAENEGHYVSSHTVDDKGMIHLTIEC